MPLVTVLLLTACGDNNDNKASSTTSAPSATTTTTEAPTANGPVRTATIGALGKVLVDDKGFTLYTFDNDKNGTIACGADCAGGWPPLVLDAGTSLPTTGTLSGDLTTVMRPEGGTQVAYQGHPLYHFAGDSAPGDAKGDGAANVWHVVKVS